MVGGCIIELKFNGNEITINNFKHYQMFHYYRYIILLFFLMMYIGFGVSMQLIAFPYIK